MALHRRVLAVPQLDDAGDLHEVDAGAVVERAGDRRARDDEHVEAAEILDERMRDRAASAQMAETERVVAVHEDPCIFETPQHGQDLPSSGSDSEGFRLAAGLKYLQLDVIDDAAAIRSPGKIRVFSITEADITPYPSHRRSWASA